MHSPSRAKLPREWMPPTATASYTGISNHRISSSRKSATAAYTPRVAGQRSDVPPLLIELVAATLPTSPSDRPPTALARAGGLAEIMRTISTTAPPTQAPQVPPVKDEVEPTAPLTVAPSLAI